MKKKNIARRALEKIGIGKRSKSANQSSSANQSAVHQMSSGPNPSEPMLAEHTLQGTAYQAPHASQKLDRKMKRRHLSNFARQCAEYIQQVLAKRKAARAARQLRSL